MAIKFHDIYVGNVPRNAPPTSLVQYINSALFDIASVDKRYFKSHAYTFLRVIFTLIGRFPINIKLWGEA